MILEWKFMEEQGDFEGDVMTVVRERGLQQLEMDVWGKGLEDWI